MLSADSISLTDFRTVLERYQTHIDTVSESKPSARVTLETLKELDGHRLSTIPDRLAKLRSLESENVSLTKEEVEQLIKWKLKHGKFRPNLLALAISNTSDQITSATSRAFQLLSKAPTSESSPSQINSNTMAALAELVTLKGIGPASASLLLSVYAPADVPFFSDEAFRWIKFHDPASTASKAGGRGWDRGLKYDKKEYVEYLAKVRVVVERLRTEGCKEDTEAEKVGAREVEMVGWVLGREHATLVARSEKQPKKGQDGTLGDAKQETKATAAAKKPPTGPEAPGSSDLRRSKRVRN